MGDVIQLEQKTVPWRGPKDGVPSLAGKALCLTCKHTWTAVAPVGTDWLECPSCGSGKGIFAKPVIYGDGNLPHWTCICGCIYFMITADAVYCPNCGRVHSGF